MLLSTYCNDPTKKNFDALPTDIKVLLILYSRMILKFEYNVNIKLANLTLKYYDEKSIISKKIKKNKWSSMSPKEKEFLNTIKTKYKWDDENQHCLIMNNKKITIPSNMTDKDLDIFFNIKNRYIVEDEILVLLCLSEGIKPVALIGYDGGPERMVDKDILKYYQKKYNYKNPLEYFTDIYATKAFLLEKGLIKMISNSYIYYNPTKWVEAALLKLLDDNRNIAFTQLQQKYKISEGRFLQGISTMIQSKLLGYNYKNFIQWIAYHHLDEMNIDISDINKKRKVYDTWYTNYYIVYYKKYKQLWKIVENTIEQEANKLKASYISAEDFFTIF
jgi:hypothetical protein